MQREIVRSSSFDSAYIAKRSFSRWKRFRPGVVKRAKSARTTMASGGENCAAKEGMSAKRCVFSALCGRQKTVADSRDVSNFQQYGLISGEMPRVDAVQLIPDRQNDVSLLLPRESVRD